MVSVLRFPSAITTDVVENNTVEVLLIRPRDVVEPMPIVVLLHYWGATDLNVAERFAQALNERGIATAIVTLPYHLRRSPPGVKSGALAIQPDTRHLRESMTQAVMDVRRLLDWIEAGTEFDSSRIGLAGISLGGVVGALVFGVEDRFSVGALLLAGGDLAHIIWNSTVTIEARLALRRSGYTEERLREELEPVEPLRYARPERKEDLLLVGARYDDVVPVEDTRKLVAAYSRPETIWLETGHYGALFVERRIYRTAAAFFDARFAGRPFEAPESLGAPTLRLGLHFNPDYELTIAAGVDLWRSDRMGRTFVSGMLTPEGPLLFGGRRISDGFSFGVAATMRRLTWGIFWSVVL
ncbi:MAG: alpha/beta hydrolase family protein [Armatimonadetes bacterium]|nr:alpha/beta hydrolase family protein [Armatimonadota bacterium]